ncbi:MAG: ACT domain-containing protein [Haloechinothrix sp.]
MRRLAIDVQPGEYVVARLDPADGAPASLFAEVEGALVSVTKTDKEVSVICPLAVWRSAIGEGPATTEGGWRLLSVRGPLEFTLTGIIAALASELAAAGVALFSLSTFDTDHVLVKETDLARAIDALEISGHEVHRG